MDLTYFYIESRYFRPNSQLHQRLSEPMRQMGGPLQGGPAMKAAPQTFQNQIGPPNVPPRGVLISQGGPCGHPGNMPPSMGQGPPPMYNPQQQQQMQRMQISQQVAFQNRQMHNPHQPQQRPPMASSHGNVSVAQQIAQQVCSI